MPEHDGRGVEVAADVEHLAAGLLGRHVFGGAKDGAGHRERDRVLGGVRGDLRDAEVDHFDEVGLLRLVREHHVLRLEVPVQHARRVRGVEGLEQLHGDACDAVGGHGARLAKLVGEPMAVDELHGDVEGAVGVFAEVVDVDAVLLLEPRCGHRFAAKARDQLEILAELRRQQLHGDALLGVDVDGLVDRAHPAVPHEPHEPVAPREDARDVGVVGGGRAAHGFEQDSEGGQSGART